MPTKRLLHEWHFRVKRSQKGHYESANYFNRLNLYLGIPTICLSVFVSGGVFASLQKEADIRIKVAIGVASVLAAIMTGLQTFLKFSQLAEKHRQTGFIFGALRREIEHKLTIPPTDPENYIKDLRTRIDKLTKDHVTIPNRIWSRIDQQMKQGAALRPEPSFDPGLVIEEKSQGSHG